MTQISDTSPDWRLAETWYDDNADGFEIATLSLGIPPFLKEFSIRLPAGVPGGARVCDAGCGAGRDTRWLMDHGFAVSAFDISAEMVAATRANCAGRITPRKLDFRDFDDPPGSYHGIWALASLLHLPQPALEDVLPRLLASLTPDGVLAFSVKEGSGARLDELGRPFSYYSAEEISTLACAALPGPGFTEARIQSAPSSTGQQRWINLLVTRVPAG